MTVPIPMPESLSPIKTAELEFIKALALAERRYLQYIDLCFQSNAQQMPMPKPEIILDFRYVVQDKKQNLSIYKSLTQAYLTFTGHTRKLPWRDAPGAFKNIGLKIFRLQDFAEQLEKLKKKK